MSKAARWLIVLAVLLSQPALSGIARADLVGDVTGDVIGAGVTSTPTDSQPAWAGRARADVEATVSVSLADAGSPDLVLQGANTSADIWLPGPGPVVLRGGFLELRFAHSEVLNPARSSLIALLNDRPVRTIILSPDNSGVTRVTAEVPADYVKGDLNHLVFDVLMSKSDAFCEPPEDKGLWTTIFADSRLTYQIGEAVPLSLDLKKLPEPFAVPWLPQPSIFTLALPATAEAPLLAAGLALATHLGQTVGGRSAELQFTPLEQASRSQEQVVVMGLPDDLMPLADATTHLMYRLTTEGWQASDGSLLAPGDGLLALLPSPWSSGKALLIVSGSDVEGLLKAVNALGTATTRAALSGSVAVIRETTFKQVEGERLVRTLASLGLPDQHFRGVGGHTARLRIPLSGQETTGSSRLRLQFRASPLLQPERSSVDVTLNGKSLTSLRLPTSQPDQIELRVDLPTEVVRPGFNSLVLAFTFYLPAMTSCGATPHEQAWATLLASSTIETGPTTATRGRDLAALPYPLVGSSAPTLFVVPDDPALWQGLFATVFAVGRQTNQPVSFEALRAGEQEPGPVLDREIVLYGTPESNRWLSFVGPRLPVSLDLVAQRRIEVDASRRALVLSYGQWGLVQIASSPWDRQRTLLVIAGTDLRAAEWAAAAVGRGGLSGEVDAVLAADRILPLDLGAGAARAEAGANLAQLAFLGALPLGLLALLSLVWRVWVQPP